MIRAISERREPQVAADFHDIVILYTRHRLPAVCQDRRIESGGDRVEAHGRTLPERGGGDGVADGYAQAVVCERIIRSNMC
jgi:hypothetical protein